MNKRPLSCRCWRCRNYIFIQDGIANSDRQPDWVKFVYGGQRRTKKDEAGKTTRNKRKKKVRGRTKVRIGRAPFAIFSRDKFRCSYCGKSSITSASLMMHLDHVIPIVEGGTNTAGNLITSCARCNSSKGYKGLKVDTLSEVLEEIIKRNKSNGLQDDLYIRV